MNSLEQLNLAAPIIGTYSEIEETILCHIAEQLAANPDMLINATSEWRIKMLAQMGRVNKDTAKIIASKVGKVPAEVQQVVQYSIDNVLSEYGLEANGKIDGSIAMALKNYDLQAIKYKYNQVNTVMKYKAKQAYVSGINSVADKLIRKKQKALENSQEYLDVLNKNAMETVLGEKSRTEAIRETIAEISKKGIPAFVDKNGREWSPEAYIDMDVRNTAKNAALAAEFASLDELGQDIILVSSHSGSRPLCAPYQGKLYSRSGKSGTITDANGKTHTYTPLSETSFGEAAGLFGINCGHHMRGVSESAFINREKEFDSEETSEEYRKIQRQRAMEREIRKKKTKANMLEAAGDMDAAGGLRRLAADENRKLRDYCEKEGIYYRRDRTEVYGYNKAVDKSKESDIIKIKDAHEANDALINKAGFSAVEESFDLIDDKLKISNTNQILKLEEKFGCIHKSEGTICSVSDSPSTIAYVRSRVTYPSKQNLSLCPKSFGSYSDLISTQRRNTESNWSMPVELTEEKLSVATVTHEYGHILQNVLIESEMKAQGWNPSEPNAFVDVTKKTSKSRLKWYFNIRSKVLNDCFSEIIAIAKERNSDFILADNISKYGCTDKAEFFAEVFMNSQLGAPNELGDAMNIWLKRKGLC